MTQKRKDHPADQTTDTPEQISAPAPVGEPAKPGETGMTWLWRILGGMLVVAAALIGGAVHQNMDRQVNLLRAQLSELNQELRRDLGRLSETHSAMIKKEDHATRMRTLWDTMKQMDGDHIDLVRLTERCAL